MRALLILALLASQAVAEGPVPIVVLRPEGASSYAFCEGAACPQAPVSNEGYLLPALATIAALCLIALWASVKAISGKGRMIRS